MTVFEPLYAQRALLAILLIALLAGAVGSLVVLRDLPFFTHAVSAGAYPFLVGAVALGVALPVGALVGAGIFAVVVTVITRSVDDVGRRDALTGMAIVFALAAGSVLAATAVKSDARLALSPESLLFGSVLTADRDVLMTAAIVAVIAVPISFVLADRWLATGFDPQMSGLLNARRFDWLLLTTIALAAAATVPITGSLLAGALLVIPAATVRVACNRFAVLAPATFLLTTIEGVLGLYLAIIFDLPTGATIAAVASAGFLIVAVARAIRTRLTKSRGPLARIAATAVVAALAAALVAGCGSSSSSEGDASATQVRVAATTPQVADIVASIGGDSVNVETLMPVGTDPHDFEPKPSDVAELADADVVVRSGGELDAWVVDAAKTAGAAKPIDLSSSVKLIAGDGESHDHEHAEEGESHSDEHAEEEEKEEHDHEGEAFNAHWYLSPSNVQSASRRLRDELVKAAPDSRESIRANADAYIAELESLDATLNECVEQVPADERVFVSGHDDFAYLAESFDFEVAAQVAPTGQSEPSARELQASIDSARDQGARAVVTSAGESSQLTKQFAQRLDVPLLELQADSLAETGKASTLPGAIEFNVERLTNAVSDGKVECGSGN
ncbi:MAG: metal ABC transporter solute-binding protein, Zn/Mn family [Solirubrobacterales bacterium]